MASKALARTLSVSRLATRLQNVQHKLNHSAASSCVVRPEPFLISMEMSQKNNTQDLWTNNHVKYATFDHQSGRSMSLLSQHHLGSSTSIHHSLDGKIPSLNRLQCAEGTPNKEYHLPTSTSSGNQVILDICRSIPLRYRCPKFYKIDIAYDLPKSNEIKGSITEPEPINTDDLGKQALRINKRRKKKIRKKHFIKLHKKMIYTIRMQGMIKRKRKEANQLEYVNNITKKAGEFNAESYIMERLDRARRGNYRAKLFPE